MALIALIVMLTYNTCRYGNEAYELAVISHDHETIP